jgi:pimeloyl-ACP methyl ester carboxylesterase
MPAIETIRVGELTVAHAAPERMTGPPVLFIHGIFADARVWTDWLPRFASRGLPAYAVNLRGRADSKPVANIGAVSIDDYVEDAASVARMIGRPAVVGHSMGGVIAQRLAERDLVRAMALVAPAPPRGIVLISAELVAKQLKYLPNVFLNRPIPPNAADLRVVALNRASPELQERVLAQLTPDSGRVGRELSITGVPVNAARVTCPVLVIAAEDDRFVPARTVARIARRYDAELRVMRGRGHMLVMEPGWESLADDVAVWITSRA